MVTASKIPPPEQRTVAPHIFGCPVIIGLKFCDALFAERPAKPSFRQ